MTSELNPEILVLALGKLVLSTRLLKKDDTIHCHGYISCMQGEYNYGCQATSLTYRVQGHKSNLSIYTGCMAASQV